MKSSETPLPTGTTRNGPQGVGSSSPRMRLRKSADARLSVAGTMVWLSETAMGPSYSAAPGSGGAPGDRNVSISLIGVRSFREWSLIGSRRQLGDDGDDMAREQLDRRSLLEPFDPPDDRVDPEPSEPPELIDQLTGGGPPVV